MIDATHTVAGQPLPTNEEDTLDGGAGADRMSGGQGDDAYVVDNPGDVDIDATHWQVNYNGGASHDIITFMNGASIDATDFLFV